MPEVMMSEVEYNRLLDAVRAAVAPVPGEDCMLAHMPIDNRPRQAANDNGANNNGATANGQNDNSQNDNGKNDNGKAWPVLPFPEGWNAAC
jgi:hypothetical protein